MKQLLAKGEKGRYYWTPVLQMVSFIPKGKRNSRWEDFLPSLSNTRQEALERALKHSVNLT